MTSNYYLILRGILENRKFDGAYSMIKLKETQLIEIKRRAFMKHEIKYNLLKLNINVFIPCLNRIELVFRISKRTCY